MITHGFKFTPEKMMPQKLWLLLLPPLLFILSAAQSENNQSNYYDLCAPFVCGNITFSFPFSSFETFGSGRYSCGLHGFQIACDSTTSVPTLQLSGRSYRVKDLYLTENLVTVVDHQLIDDLRSSSCRSLGNLSFSETSDTGALEAAPRMDYYFTFFKCPHELDRSLAPPVVGNVRCNEGPWLYLWHNESWKQNQRGPPIESQPVVTPIGCQLLTLPVFRASLARYGFLNFTTAGVNGGSGDRQMELLPDLLSDGFPLQWGTVDGCGTCQQENGRCGYDLSTKTVTCLCKDVCDSATHKRKSNKWKLIVGVATASSVMVLALPYLVFRFRHKTSAIFRSYLAKNSAREEERNAKQIIKEYQSMLLTNHSYSDIKKMTKNFKEKLGEGGYGSVYKGELPVDGRPVAVKVLENRRGNNNGHDFFNEVATIGRIHHVNVIRLLGFCWDGSKRALIYEFMPNGSLDDLLSANPSLRPEKLLEIAVGVAHGIEYLHNGCESRILHLDIKPQNVLLDRDFTPKISDFGLAKVYSRSRSAVTMTGGARGTIGYIAPEIFMRNLGNPSHKSDVYSFGMLILGMVGESRYYKPEIDDSSASEAYFPGWLHDLVVAEEINNNTENIVEEEGRVVRKMVMIGLWCIQISPTERPTMTQVVVMLAGKVEAIGMPPKPSFFSPPTPRVRFEHEIGSAEDDFSELPLTFDSHDLISSEFETRRLEK